MSNREQRFTLGLLAMEGSVLSSLIGPTDMFRIAQKLAQVRDPGTPLRLETVLVGARGLTHVNGSGGLQLSGVQSPDLSLDCLLIPGIMHDSAEDLVNRLAAYQPEMELLRAMHLRGVPLIAACCGGFLLAETGLLDGHNATTSWWLDAAFRKRYPHVQLDVERMIIEDGMLTTTGASTAIYTYILQLLAKRVDESLAQLTGRMMLIDTERQSQAPYISLALTERPRHSLSEKAERFIQQQLHRELTVSELAEYCDTSERSLLRHFRQHYNASPIGHIQHLRVERAKALLETTLMSFDEIVERCGYHDSASFRKLFKRATHLTPADYRERFRLRA
ncbi:MAG TPA: helix-turn-helix domain-containing protein [Arenimonas sp.]|nr:helix-turn-helix domain-containing protein [Arenimonas sp.]HOZ04262.1 helix-turn-helix domain-containing protein [Arenimonas sp.]HPO23867.1 helix-turn-helix domain-containing protein [Arenimonas sp.]HPW31400.1 helix-turn-helix domain-containing protein [Arenimonas sp.]